MEPAHRLDELLELAVIGLGDVVEVFDLPVFNVLWAFTFLLQRANGLAVAAGLVGVDFARLLPILAALYGFAPKAFGRLRFAPNDKSWRDRYGHRAQPSWFPGRGR